MSKRQNIRIDLWCFNDHCKVLLNSLFYDVGRDLKITYQRNYPIYDLHIVHAVGIMFAFLQLGKMGKLRLMIIVESSSNFLSFYRYDELRSDIEARLTTIVVY